MKPGMKYEGAELTAFDPIKALDISDAGSADYGADVSQRTQLVYASR